MKNIVRIAFTAFALTASLLAQPRKLPVSVSCSTEDKDYVAKRLCSSLQDQVMRSPRYQLVSDNDDLHWEISFASAAVSTAATASSTVLAIKDDKGQELVDHWATITGSKQVESQAEDMFAAVDEKIMAIIRAVSSSKSQVTEQ